MSAGMKLYLAKHKYSNAVTVDLWDALGAAAGKPVASLMADWTGVSGYPVITVSSSGALTQTRFLSAGPPTPEQDTTVWK